jgi:transcriptional regulator GlxA family with amidase domain
MRTQRFGFLLVPGFSMMSFTSAVEPLRSANRLAERRLYEWLAITPDGQPMPASSGIGIVAQAAIDDLPRLDYLFVVAGIDAHTFQDKQVFGYLRRLAREGCRMGGLTTGTYALARAGLLDGHRCTIHWENLAAFREEFPDLETTQELFEIDRGRLTCAGGTAAMDLMLSLMALEHGRDLAAQVADQFMVERIRDHDDPQRMALRNRLGINHPKLLAVIADMEQHQEDPLPRSQLARRAGLSTRQLERLFRKYLDRTPTRYYLELRLGRARHLLAESTLSVLDVAMACGFVSASHFSKCYREYFGRTPRQERTTAA